MTMNKTIVAAAFAGFFLAGPALAEDMMSGYGEFITGTLTQSDETILHGHEHIVADPRELERLAGLLISFDGQGQAHCLPQNVHMTTPQRHGRTSAALETLCSVDAVGVSASTVASYYEQRAEAFTVGKIACATQTHQNAELDQVNLSGKGVVMCRNDFYVPFDPVDMDTEATRAAADEYVKSIYFIFKYMMEVEGLDVNASALKSEAEAVADATE